MGYDKFVQIGRVVMISAGPLKGKLAVICDVIDQNRGLIDGPATGVPRGQLNFKAVHLTKFVIKIGPGARTSTVRKAWEKSGVEAKWKETSWAKRIEAKAKRAEMNDFDRFKLMRAKQARRRIQKTLFGRVVKSMRGAKPKAKK